MKMSFLMSSSVLLLLLAFPSVISEVVGFSKCKSFFFNGKPPVSPQGSQYKAICQKYKGGYRFATLYDTTNRIPVFSAYKIISENRPKRPENNWNVEPQLEQSSDEMGVPYENQAIDEDFFNNNENVNRGHLFPCCHSGDNDTARATFTLTNIVPQKKSFNGGSWNRMEIKTSEVMRKYCRDNNKKILAHVLTGAVPGRRYLNKRVNIPSFMWMTFCCFNSSADSWMSQAYWAPNEDENEADNVTINEISLHKLQKLLSDKRMKITQLFDNNYGIGRTLKRTADNLVRQEQDLPDAESLFYHLKNSGSEVRLFYFGEEDVHAWVQMIEVQPLSTIKGSMKIHQVVSTEPGFLKYGGISCFCQAEKGAYDKQLSFDSSLHPEIIESKHIGQCCVLNYDEQPYPGIIQEVENHNITIKCMHRNGINKFFWPSPRDDIHWYSDDQVICFMPLPVKKKVCSDQT